MTKTICLPFYLSARNCFLFIVAFYSILSTASAQGVWTQKADVGGAIRRRAVGFSFAAQNQ